MSEWQPLLQSIFIGLIFSYLLAKLISVVVSFRDDNLTVTRSATLTVTDHREPHDAKLDDVVSDENNNRTFEAESVTAEQGSVRDDSVYGGDDDDWEGVESTELDKAFSAATAFVAAAADRLSQKVPNDVQFQLYGLYKIATEGPCSTPQPSPLKMTARAKWQAWQKLGAMPPEDAMQKYIDIVTELYPSWATGSSLQGSKSGDGDGSSSEAKGPMGPVFSTFVYEEEYGSDLKMDAIHGFSREGDMDNVLKCIENGASVNLKDSEGRSPLHWAVDRGHLNVIELLVGRNADVNAKDNDGQTPLHYAVMCEREAIAEYLVKHNADTYSKDNDGSSPRDICESNWPCMQQAGEVN